MSYTAPENDTEQCYQYIFEESTNKGTKTGSGVALTINKAGEFIALSHHEGNPEIALNSTAKISKQDAVKIAQDYIKSQQHLANVKDLPKETADLVVWEDKLSWRIEITNIIGEGTINGFSFFIDAQNGDILFKDNYCSGLN